MRNLEYVHFIDEELGIPESISNLGWKELKRIISSDEWKDILRSRKISHED
jgi:hypothetical protein